jgi:predicted permease
MRIALPESRYAEHHQRADFFRKTLDRIDAIPGVVSAAIINDLPATYNWDIESFEVEGRPAPSLADRLVGDFSAISADYFRTMRIPLIEGRALAKQDEASATPVAVISVTAARRFFPNQSPLGQRIRVEIGDGDWPWHTIIGVVGDVRQFVFDREPHATVYIPYAQLPRAWFQTMTLAVRTAGDPLSMFPAAREQIRGVDPDQPVYRIKTMEQMIAEHITPISLSAEWMAIFGLLALLLAAVGVYSVMAYAVSQRTREIAVRIALGAQTSDVLRLVTGQGMKLVMTGMAIGLIVAFALARALAGWLYGVDAIDPATFGAVAIGLSAVALLACYIPARRAAKVDPMVALRCE